MSPWNIQYDRVTDIPPHAPDSLKIFEGRFYYLSSSFFQGKYIQFLYHPSQNPTPRTPSHPQCLFSRVLCLTSALLKYGPQWNTVVWPISSITELWQSKYLALKDLTIIVSIIHEQQCQRSVTCSSVKFPGSTNLVFQAIQLVFGSSYWGPRAQPLPGTKRFPP